MAKREVIIQSSPPPRASESGEVQPDRRVARANPRPRDQDPRTPVPGPATRLIRSTRFGEIEAPEDQLLHFPLGIPGFAHATAFVLVQNRPTSAFRWLQAVDDSDLALLVIDAASFMPDYPIEDVRRALAFCELASDEEIAVLAICCVPPEPEPPTVNLQAPVGIGLRSRRGAQILLHETRFDMRMPLVRSW